MKNCVACILSNLANRINTMSMTHDFEYHYINRKSDLFIPLKKKCDKKLFDKIFLSVKNLRLKFQGSRDINITDKKNNFEIIIIQNIEKN